MSIEQDHSRDDFVTIIAPTMSAVMEEFKARDLAALGYAIIGRVGRHRFQLAGFEGGAVLFGGEPMLAATFARSHATHA